MRVTAHPSGRFLGYVHVQVGWRVYALPIEARRLIDEDGAAVEAGLSADGADRFRIVVDSEAPDAVVKQAGASPTAPRPICARTTSAKMRRTTRMMCAAGPSRELGKEWL